MADAHAETTNTPSIEKLVSRLREIQSGLKQNLASLHLKLELLDAKPELLFSLESESARQDAETCANSLEAEVEQLREELRTIKALLGLKFEKQSPDDS